MSSLANQSYSNAKLWSPEWRKDALDKLKSDDATWDLIVVGGGITGAGVYREAVQRGLKVLLIEQKDFAWGTSSRSSKMVHGGLRYLGSGQFGLANDSVKERQSLMNELPGLVNPLPFLMGHYKGVFPGPWIFDKLLAIYDWMAGKRYRQFRKKGIQDFWAPGLKQKGLQGATQFADAVTDDARLVLRVLNEANKQGGVAINYVKALDTVRDSGRVTGLCLRDEVSGEDFKVKARVIVNATGAWTDTLRQSLGHHKVIRPLRGSHLVVPFWRLPVAFTVSFFHREDKRPVFVFPWEGVTVIGTTDLDHQDDLTHEASITNKEVAYLLDAANEQFPESRLQVSDIRSSWSGVRPVVSKHQDAEVDISKPSDEKREHAIWDDSGLISVAGGKLTTYRLIALDVLKHAKPYLETLLVDDLNRPTAFAPIDCDPTKPSTEKRKRLSGRYGADTADAILALEIDGIQPDEKIATTDTLWGELIWACNNESVVHLDDLLLRRSRIGLLLDRGGLTVLPKVKLICQHCLGWTDEMWQQELVRYEQILATHYSLPEISGEPSHDS